MTCCSCRSEAGGGAPAARRAAQSKVIQDTFVVDEKNKKKARLSWYHPADTVRARPPA